MRDDHATSLIPDNPDDLRADPKLLYGILDLIRNQPRSRTEQEERIHQAAQIGIARLRSRPPPMVGPKSDYKSIAHATAKMGSLRESYEVIAIENRPISWISVAVAVTTVSACSMAAVAWYVYDQNRIP